ncbi:hypothetical protein [Pseudanabaena sp. BC1403]|uniref:hypothetical protein n=1 Tax=Pseudanabaena sp. BC1403 TaxID=2043171 RepID=UPI000CD9C6AC|nr:hypothetical protein [Pseudanabaena sp. BC1403]
MIDKIFGAIRRMIARSERDMIEEKLGEFNGRLYSLEAEDREINTKLTSMHEVNMANNESLEQKLNLSKVTQETIKSTIELRFAYVDKAFDDLKALIRDHRT